MEILYINLRISFEIQTSLIFSNVLSYYLLCSTIPTVCITITVIVTYLIGRRVRLANKQFEDNVKLIRNGDYRLEFPVFLSYSSRNHAFVQNHILEPLQVGYCIILCQLQYFFCFIHISFWIDNDLHL